VKHSCDIDIVKYSSHRWNISKKLMNRIGHVTVVLGFRYLPILINILQIMNVDRGVIPDITGLYYLEIMYSGRPVILGHIRSWESASPYGHIDIELDDGLHPIIPRGGAEAVKVPANS